MTTEELFNDAKDKWLQYCVNRYRYLVVELNLAEGELEQMVLLLIWKACERWDASRGLAFSTYLLSCMQEVGVLLRREHGNRDTNVKVNGVLVRVYRGGPNYCGNQVVDALDVLPGIGNDDVDIFNEVISSFSDDERRELMAYFDVVDGRFTGKNALVMEFKRRCVVAGYRGVEPFWWKECKGLRSGESKVIRISVKSAAGLRRVKYFTVKRIGKLGFTADGLTTYKVTRN